MRLRSSLVLLTLVMVSSASIKTLSSSCFCDVSSSCDPYCCCDSECSTTLIYNWNNYTLCSNDGYAIPLCSYYYNQTTHTHDLYQGLRLIYTIIKRLFCITKINFVDSTAGFISKTTDSQINIASNTVSALSSNINNLDKISNYSKLPLRSSMGLCGSFVLRDMNNIQEESCRTYISSLSALPTHQYLSLTLFAGNNNLLTSSLPVYYLKDASKPSASSTFSASSSCTGTTCLVVKQIKLTFIKSGSIYTVDYGSSYIVMGNTLINGPTYINIKYSYSFISAVSNYGYSSALAYSKTSLLALLKSSTNSTYYKIFNPVNLAFINTDGTCRTASTNDSDQSSSISLRFGVNSVYSCIGSSSDFAYTNLKEAFDYVGSLGTSTTNLADFIKIDYSSISSNQNIKLVFNYIQIGTKSDPQYQITKATASPVTSSGNGQFSLFIQYVAASNPLVLNLPSPPIIDAYLPNDFLYPFYVA